MKVSAYTSPASARGLRRAPGFLAKQSFLPSRSYSRPRQRVILLQVVFIFWRVLEAVSLYWLMSAPGLGTHFFTGSSLYWLVSARGLRRDPGIYSEVAFVYWLVFLFEIFFGGGRFLEVRFFLFPLLALPQKWSKNSRQSEWLRPDCRPRHNGQRVLVS